MEDVLTETPPPSRFFDEDLDNFAFPSPPLPSPFLVLQNPNPNPNPNYNLLLIFISPQSLSLLHQIPSETQIASLFLPELPLSPPSSSSPISIFSLSTRTLIAAVPCRIAPGRSKAVARLLLKNFDADRTVIFDSIDGEKYRGRIDEATAVKMETREERGLGLVRGVEVAGPGTLAEGLGAALMVECEMRRRKGTLVLTWRGYGSGVAARVLKGLVRNLGVEVGDVDDDDGASHGGGGGAVGAAAASSWLESDLYT